MTVSDELQLAAKVAVFLHTIPKMRPHIPGRGWLQFESDASSKWYASLSLYEDASLTPMRSEFYSVAHGLLIAEAFILRQYLKDQGPVLTGKEGSPLEEVMLYYLRKEHKGDQGGEKGT